MRLLIIAVLVIFIVLISYQNVRFYLEWHAARSEYKALQGRLQTIEEGNKALEEEILYYQNPENLAKEARAQLNYKKPGEKVIVIVPSE